MAPEQARGETVDHRADLFSLGSVLYAMCTGHPPFRAGTTLAVLRRVSEERPRPLREVNPEIPAWLAGIVAKLHAADPAARYQTAAEIADVLGRHLADLQRPTAQPPLTKKPPLDHHGDDWGTALDCPKSAATEAATRRGGWLRGRSAMLVAAIGFVCAALGTAQFAGFGRFANMVALTPQQRDANNPPKVATTPKDEQNNLIVGSGKPITNELAIADFDSLEILHPFQVEIVRSDRFRVAVTADDNVIDHIKAVKEGKALSIALEENKTYRLKAGSLGLKIGMPALSKIGLSHGARGTIGGFKSERPFMATVTHGSLLEGEVEAGDAVLNASHGSTIRLKGKARDSQLRVSHGSTLLLDELSLRALDVDTQHGSTARVNSRSPQTFKAIANHGSTLIGSVEAERVSLDADHGSQAILDGSARQAVLKSHHSGRLELGQLSLDRAEVELAHSSSAIIHAKDSIDYRLSEGSRLMYVGKPKLGRSESSHGSSARSITADEAARDKVNPPKEPSAARPPQGDMIITTGMNMSSIHIGSHTAGLILGSGLVATKAVDVSGFRAVEADLPCVLEITKSDAFKVALTADDNVLDHIKVVKDDETLKLSLDQGAFQVYTRMKATVSMPAIDSLTLDGAAQAKIQGFDSERPFIAHLDGATQLEGSIKAGQLTIHSDGASSTTLQGAARSLTLKSTGASRVDLRGLPVETADLILDGASQAHLDVQKQLSYSVSGASNLQYSGKPTIQRAMKQDVSSVSHD